MLVIFSKRFENISMVEKYRIETLYGRFNIVETFHQNNMKTLNHNYDVQKK